MTDSHAARVVALSAGLRTPSSSRRLSDALLTSIVQHLGERGEHALTRTIEVRDHAIDATCTLLSGVRSDQLADALGAVERADLLVVATPVYNGSYSGLFKSFVDLLDPGALLGKPVVLAATGGSLRHSLVVDQELRPLFSFFQAAPVATGVFATNEDWRAPGVPDAALAARIDRAAWEAASTAALGSRTTTS